ncbi:hypothetical protein [Paraburkholderia sp. J41]|uniref:hypothetical protein n=1 Tax=Paraburkholderia sp. J41 TaxID=2805433 RepID=UPI002AC3301E|nr:hypothetical protein [Paraburkholderia sp. J41]
MKSTATRAARAATRAAFPPQDPTLNAGGAFAAPEPSQDEAGAWSAAVLSRLSFCIAWLFGLEAFFADSASADTRSRMRAPRR